MESETKQGFQNDQTRVASGLQTNKTETKL